MAYVYLDRYKLPEPTTPGGAALEGQAGGKVSRSGIQLVEHPWEWNRFPHMLDSTYPRHGPFDPHAEARMRHGPILSKVHIPPERVFREFVLANAPQEFVMVVDSLAATDDFPVPLRRQHVHTKRQVRPLRVILHIKCLDGGGIAVDDDWFVEFR